MIHVYIESLSKKCVNFVFKIVNLCLKFLVFARIPKQTNSDLLNVSFELNFNIGI